jgi:hypothetical protein
MTPNQEFQQRWKGILILSQAKQRAKEEFYEHAGNILLASAGNRLSEETGNSVTDTTVLYGLCKKHEIEPYVPSNGRFVPLPDDGYGVEFSVSGLYGGSHSARFTPDNFRITVAGDRQTSAREISVAMDYRGKVTDCTAATESDLKVLSQILPGALEQLKWFTHQFNQALDIRIAREQFQENKKQPIFPAGSILYQATLEDGEQLVFPSKVAMKEMTRRIASDELSVWEGRSIEEWNIRSVCRLPSVELESAAQEDSGPVVEEDGEEELE